MSNAPFSICMTPLVQEQLQRAQQMAQAACWDMYYKRLLPSRTALDAALLAVEQGVRTTVELGLRLDVHNEEMRRLFQRHNGEMNGSGI